MVSGVLPVYYKDQSNNRIYLPSIIRMPLTQQKKDLILGAINVLYHSIKRQHYNLMFATYKVEPNSMNFVG